MKNEFITSNELFRDIKAREIYNIDYYKNLNQVQKDDVFNSAESNYKYIKNKLESAIGSLGLEISKYKNNRNQWKIPAEEEELFIRAYVESTSPAGKKLRGIKKGELDISEIHKEIKSMKELIDKKDVIEDSEDAKGYLEYITNFKILEKVNEIKQPINQIILENMENILNWEKYKHRLLNIDDAVYLIDFYKDLIERTTKMWNGIIDIFSEIRDSENEVSSYTYSNLEIEYIESETILTEAIKEYNQRISNSKLKKEYSEDELKSVKEVLESYLKATR